MEETKKLAKEILEQALIMSLGTVDESGVWVSDVVFVYQDDFSIYWISRRDSRHSIALEKNPKVSCTITASFEPNNEKALQIEGRAKFLGGDHEDLEKLHYQKRGKPYLNSTSTKKPANYEWYTLIPTKIEMHYSQKYGYIKQKIL